MLRCRSTRASHLSHFKTIIITRGASRGGTAIPPSGWSIGLQPLHMRPPLNHFLRFYSQFSTRTPHGSFIARSTPKIVPLHRHPKFAQTFQPSIGFRSFHSSMGTLYSSDDSDRNDFDDEDEDEDEDEEEEDEGEEEEEDENSQFIVEGMPQEQDMSAIQMMAKTEKAPEQVLVLPVIKTSILPGTVGTAVITDPEFWHELENLKASGQTPHVGLFLVRNVEEAIQQGAKVTGPEQIYQVGVLGVITQMSKHNVPPTLPSSGNRKATAPVGAIQFIAVPQRIKITDVVPDTKRLTVNIEALQDLPYDANDVTVRGTQAELESVVHRIAEIRTDTRNMLRNYFWSIYNPLNAAEAADFIASVITHFSVDDSANSYQQRIIEELDVAERLKKAVALTKRELNLSQLTRKIKEEMDQKMEERHRQMLLRDELKAIRAELGLEKPQTETLLAKFKERIAAKKIPEQARKVIDEEMDRFTHLQPSTSEYNVVRTHLDWLTLLPWGTYSKENLNMLHAEKILEEDHYGLQDVKDRILEFIAVGNLKGEVTGKIICLVGPPGVGKTSIGKSIAHALGREFYRFSVGGMTDEAEIKGHRRTYIGAMPGKLLQALKVVNTSNPVILIDEIDKLGTGGYKGDPSSALLEVLDPEQNVSFLDHYLDVNYDLSKVLFVCTANVTHTIPRPLLDRMEVIRLSGYVEEEKAQIASRYLIPRALTETGLSEKQVHTTDGAVRKLINSYCREAGVRNLQHQIEKIYRKVAYKLVNAKEGGLEVDQTTNQLRSKLPPHPIDAEVVAPAQPQPQPQSQSQSQSESQAATHSEKDQQSLIDQPKIDITENNLEEYLGKAPYTSDRYYAQTPPGVVMGLAWTSMGGSTPYIETVLDRFQYLKLIAQREKQASKATTTTDIHFKNKKKKQQQSVKSQPADRPAGGGGGAGGGSGRLVTTGQLGDVMKESSNIAYTYAKLFWAKLHQQKKQRPLAKLSLQDSQPHQMHTALHQLDQSNAENTNMKPMGASPPQLNPKQEETWNQQFFNDALLHMHLPEGATPKDGPSAGISMVTSLLSLAMNKPVRQNLAMTGEITLTGKVLPVGGIKEKVIAARRANVTTLIFPIENKKDWLELPDYIKQGLHVHFADYYQDVFDVAFAEAESTQHSADTQQQPQSVTAAHTTNSHQPAAYHHYSTQSHSFF